MAMKDISDGLVCLAVYHYKQNFNKEALYPYEYLQKWSGECFKVCYKCMERACDRGLIEYGVSLRAGWLTDKGKDLLMQYVEKNFKDSLDVIKNSGIIGS